MAFRAHIHLNALFAAVALCYVSVSHAASSEQTLFPLNPRLSLWGGMGNNNYGRLDAMAPLFGSSSTIFYTDVDGESGKNKAYLASIGLGIRDAVNNDWLWGGYVFGDRSRSQEIYGGNDWLVINPGVEFMTPQWDGRINGYIPANRDKQFLNTLFADQAGMGSLVSFSGHTQFSPLLDQMEEIGTGADADAGYTFRHLNKLRVHGGAYYFHMPDTSDIQGAEAGVEMPLNKYITLELNNTYDNVQHNNTVVSLRFTLGSIQHHDNISNVRDRILDPIERHLGTISNSNGIPVRDAFVNTGKTLVERSNIWFFTDNGGSNFAPSAGTQNCTYEHPCSNTSFNQTNLEAINNISAGANLYFSPGNYSAEDSGNPVTLYSGQSMYGRTADYKMPASSANYPVFTGALALQGNSTLDSFALINDGTQDTGIDITNADNVTMSNLQVGQLNTAEGYAYPVYLDNARNITLSHSTINAMSDTQDIASITVNNGSTLEADANIVNAMLNINSGNVAFGIETVGSTINVRNNTFNISGNGINNGVIGISEDGGTANITANTFNLTGGENTGLIGISITNGAIMNATANTFTILGGINSDITGIMSGSSVLLNANSNIFNLEGSNADSIIGIDNSGGTLIGNNNTFNFSGTATTQTCGHFTSGSGNVFNGGCT